MCIRDSIEPSSKEREDYLKNLAEKEQVVASVSYTHLDVYKRQVLKSDISTRFKASTTRSLISFKGIPLFSRPKAISSSTVAPTN